jgi:serine phosphatase RsbU (regulator of sigma subunit)
MTVLNYLNSLETAGLVRIAQIEPELEYLFRHALIQNAAYESILNSDRKDIHRAVGHAIEELYTDRRDEYAATLAHHFVMAGEEEIAHRYFIIAGKSALEAYANEEAEFQFRQALELSCFKEERIVLFRGLAEALYRQSRFDESQVVIDKAIAVSKINNDINSLAQFYARSARIAWHAGDTPGCLSISKEGLEQISGAPDSGEIASLIHETARAYLFNGSPDKALKLCRKALLMAEETSNIEVQADALATLGVTAKLPKDEVLDVLNRAVELSEQYGLLQIAGRAHHNLGVMITGLKGDMSSAREHYLKAGQIARKRGVVSEELFSLISTAGASLSLGEMQSVEESIPRFEKLLNQIDDPKPMELSLNGIKVHLLWLNDETQKAIDLCRACIQESRERGDLQLLLDFINTLVGFSFESFQYGELIDFSKTETLLTESIDIGEKGLGGEVNPISMMSILKAHSGDHEKAQQLLEIAQEKSLLQPSVWNDVIIATTIGEIYASQSNWDEATSAMEQVSSIYAKIGVRWNWARSLQRWAETLILQGSAADLARAQALLREAQDTYIKMGTRRYISMVDRQLSDLQIKSFQQLSSSQVDTQDLSRARRVQESFLPETLPDIEGWDISLTYQPARQISGDFYDFIPLKGNKIGIVIADVADKGAAAALYMASSRSLIRTFANEYNLWPEIVIAETNRRILLDTHENLFVTVFYGILDPDQGKLKYCNAGHNPPLLVGGGDNGNHRLITRTGMALGISIDSTWESRSVDISPGQVLVLYTDGITDAQNTGEQMFGEIRMVESLITSVNSPADEIRNTLMEDVDAFIEGAAQFDDITLMVIRRE